MKTETLSIAISIPPPRSALYWAVMFNKRLLPSMPVSFRQRVMQWHLLSDWRNDCPSVTNRHIVTTVMFSWRSAMLVTMAEFIQEDRTWWMFAAANQAFTVVSWCCDSWFLGVPLKINTMHYDALCYFWRQVPIYAKAYLMVSNSLTLESWKVRSLRLDLESLTNVGSFFTFWGQNQLCLHYLFPEITVSKLIPKNFTCFLVKVVGSVVFSIVDSTNLVKLALTHVKYQAMIGQHCIMWSECMVNPKKTSSHSFLNLDIKSETNNWRE